MKKLLFSIVAILGLAINFATAQQAPMAGAVMAFEKKEIDYGTIKQNSDPLRKFKFKNTGTEPLVIKNAKGSCGCTVPNYKKEPIMPGETSEIEVRYATDRVGGFTKTITVETNEAGGTPQVLTIKGEVLATPAEPGTPTNAPSVLGGSRR